jgi:hypothetical protein
MADSVERTPPDTLGNRRSHRRAALSAPVLVDSARTHQTGRCRDVSLGGLCVELESPLPVGTVVELYFELPTGIAIEAQAKVARSAERALAMSFEGLGDGHRAALAAYCESWRLALLNHCAERVASIPNQRLTASAVAGTTSDFDTSEAQSGVRIRTAVEWNAGKKP